MATGLIIVERRFNPLLQLSRDEFVNRTTEPSPRPLNMSAILATNTGRSDAAWLPVETHPPVASVAADAAPRWLRTHDALIVDVRERWEYAAEHLPAATSIPQADLARRLSELPRDRDLLVVCQSGARSLHAAQFLRAAGYDRVANLEGGTQGWMQAGHPIAG